MRVATVGGRLKVWTSNGWADVEQTSARFPADPQEIYPRWDEFRTWAGDLELGPAEGSGVTPGDSAAWGAPCPRPRQVFAIGLNYRDHASEAGLDAPDFPRPSRNFLAASRVR